MLTSNELCTTMEMANTMIGEKYMGAPEIVGRNKKAIFEYVKDKVWRQICGWNFKFLSRGDKEVLLKVVPQATPAFVMSIFLLPRSLCIKIKRMMNSFWWGKDKSKGKGIHWAAWDRLYELKMHGGLAFKNLHNHNLALVPKQAWRLLSQPQSLTTRIFKAKYYPTGRWIDVKIGANPSYMAKHS